MSDSEEGSVKAAAIPPPPGKKFFLSHCNTYEGLALFNELWNKEYIEGLWKENDYEEEDPTYAFNTFVGTSKKGEMTTRLHSQELQEAPKGFEKFVNFERTKEFRDALLACDVIVYDLMSNTFEEVDYVIKTLKSSPLTNEKTLVLLSSVMTWVNTPPKLHDDEKEGEGEEDQAADEEEEAEPSDDDSSDVGKEDEEVPEEEDDAEKPKKLPVKYFKETDFHLRVPHEDFEHLKTLETLAMSSTTTQPKLKVHVMCSGIRYGNGERIFYDHFQKAWIQNPSKLPIIGEGRNRVPTIHIIDLARIVKRVVSQGSPLPYIFAVDKTKRPTQKRLIKSIAKGIGTGAVEKLKREDGDASWDSWAKFLTINLKMKTSEAFKDGELADDNELEGSALDRAMEDVKFPWHAEEGLVGSMTKLNEEFNSYRGLNPVKIFVTGPPASGKTFYSEKLAHYYNIPRVHVSQLTDELIKIANVDEEELDADNEWLTKVHSEINELREKAANEIDEARPDPESDQEEEPPTDPKTCKVRIPEEFVYKLLRDKLQENACRNRGYVLDGYPRTFKDAQYCFLMKPKVVDEDGVTVDEDDDDDDEEGKKDFSKHHKDEKIFPKSCVLLTGSDQDLINRVKELPEEALEGTHYNFDDMRRRLKSYRKANNSEVAEPSVQQFFDQQSISIFQESITTPVCDALDSFKIYVERNERPYNYMTYDEEEEAKRAIQVRDELQLKLDKEESKALQEEQLEKVLKYQKELAIKQNIKALDGARKDQIDAKSQPIRQYLIDNLVPILTDGMIDVCKKQPDDVCDFLAEYLFKRSLDVPYPDPTTY